MYGVYLPLANTKKIHNSVKEVGLHARVVKFLGRSKTEGTIHSAVAMTYRFSADRLSLMTDS